MMASYFGEILEPASRVIFEEFSDDEEETKSTLLRLSWSQTKEISPAALDTVFVYHGKLSLAFAEAYVIPENSVPVGEIVGETDDTEEDDIIYPRGKSLPTRIYLDNNVMTCLVSPTQSSELACQFVNCIDPFLTTAKKVVIFTDECSNNYRASSLRDLPPAFMRELKTSHGHSDFIVEELPIPNIVAGVPAAVASWCQIYKKDASLFICYTDQQKLDSVTAFPYLSVIKKLNPMLIRNTNPDLSRKKFYGNPDIIGGSSNIYI